MADAPNPEQPTAPVEAPAAAPAEAPTTEAPAAEAPAAEAPAADGEDAGTSKKAAKKAAAAAKKEAEKARKAAERAEQEAKAKAARIAADVDHATANYGDVTPAASAGVSAPRVHLRDVGEEHVDKPIKLRAWVQNSRSQSAKMAFVELREERNWSIQAIAAVNADGSVSKQMVKFISNIRLESYVLVEAVVRKPKEPVQSCKVALYELHVTKCFVISHGPEMLGLTLSAASRAVSSVDEEDAAGVEQAPGSASLVTHLNNPAMHKRAPVQQAISDVRATVRKIFANYLDARRFVQFEPPCLIGAASEGGANVFQLPYFGTTACLAQSPQFYKQMEIAGGRKRVFSISPVFRAEHSNTPRHMTEFTGLDLEMEIEDDYTEVRDLVEDLLLNIFRGIKETCAEEVELIRSVYPSDEFLLPEPGKEVRLTFAEGQKLLREEGPEEFRNVSDDEDMSTPQEKALGAVVRKKYGTDFYILDKFPEEARPFYAIEDPENPKVTNAFDFFMRGQVSYLDVLSFLWDDMDNGTRILLTHCRKSSLGASVYTTPASSRRASARRASTPPARASRSTSTCSSRRACRPTAARGWAWTALLRGT
jgi:aspartyl/asparaginyl-tRNA synthetase